ncbi:hypothetical protein [Fulvivirga lutimaris]|uniref:hypothetical protein n=1 Tax=Fulvivirga lutimaris TaxID=1819566 RepID=UPI0012BC62D5|nr:hypothetical protein [Fulvivirga lutimaris]MTI38738.1 hypothetical protein [Fulvivirga lutimaris]
MMFRFKWVVLLCFVFSISYSQDTDYPIYKTTNQLSPQFINALCQAARTKQKVDNSFTSQLEVLISEAAGINYKSEELPETSFKWFTKYGDQCHCPSDENFEEGNILRQVVQANFREFANIIGPNNRLSLNLEMKDAKDGLTLLEYVNKCRIDIEKSHNDKRFEFQQDEEWRNIMFFYFLFSEYSIN